MDTETARIRSAVLTEIRSFFTEAGFLEVDTPLLSPYLIPEPTIENFSTIQTAAGEPEREFYLVPSPEVWMKKLIAEGYGSIFQICKCFRNGEQQGRQHNPEFTMLEWYTLDADYTDNIHLTEELFARMVPFGLPEPARPPFRRMSMDEACMTFAGFQPSESSDIESIIRAAENLGITSGPEETWESVFNRIFIEKIEPELPRDRPLILHDYPAQIPTLARIKEDGMHYERWELYAGGFECANCYSEETDYQKVAAYFASGGGHDRNEEIPHNVDRTWPDMYRNSYPRVSGVALGVDRLIAVILGRTSLEGVIFFPQCDIIEK